MWQVRNAFKTRKKKETILLYEKKMELWENSSFHCWRGFSYGTVVFVCCCFVRSMIVGHIWRFGCLFWLLLLFLILTFLVLLLIWLSFILILPIQYPILFPTTSPYHPFHQFFWHIPFLLFDDTTFIASSRPPEIDSWKLVHINWNKCK